MTHQEFDALVSRLETFAERAPGRYRMRVALLACLGYAYLFLVLALLLAMLGLVAAAIMLGKGSLIFLKLAIAPAAVASVILSSLRVTLPVPQGLTLDRGQAPELFRLLDEVRAVLKAPPFHRVLLTDEFNAAVAQAPRLGVFGWQQNFLLLGLPMMQALTPEQFQAVIAHETGHLSGNHGRFGGWIYRVRQTWLQVLENLHKSRQRRAAAWFRRFFDWYAPYFGAYSFVLARGNEYQADRCAVEVAGTSATAQALITTELCSRFLEERFWPDVYKKVEQQPRPPRAFMALEEALRVRVAPEDARVYFRRALGEETGTVNTHPSLSDRLKALGCLEEQEQAFQEALSPSGRDSSGDDSAALRYLGPALPGLQRRLEDEWTRQVAPGWEKRHGQIEEGRRHLADLTEKARTQPLTEEEAWQRACGTAASGDSDAARALFQEIVQARPDHVGARMALGQLRLQQSDPDGIAHLEAAMAADPGVILDACGVAFEFWKRQGRTEEAETFRRRAEDRHAVLIRAREEREEVGAGAQFEAHGLPTAAVEELCGQLKNCRDARAAYLVRKKVEHLPEHPLYVLWVVPGFITTTSHQNIVRRIAPQIKFPGQMHLLVTDGSDLRLLKIRRTLKNARIYRR